MHISLFWYVLLIFNVQDISMFCLILSFLCMVELRLTEKRNKLKGLHWEIIITVRRNDIATLAS